MKNKQQSLFFSIIIPVYNRPEEVRELLESLAAQSYAAFEVIIIEDGSTETCEEVVKLFQQSLNINYISKENTGQGFSRNAGFNQAKGDYFVVFDSDCLIPENYFEEVNNQLNNNWLDAYGGPDRAHESFSDLQKAISYSMTSPFTTGGIRGQKRHAGTFRPRSFNMGISREVFEKTGGFNLTRLGEDIEFSIRINKMGFNTGLIPTAFVFHKRRTSLTGFFRQLHFFGRARINIGRFHPNEIKSIHWLPAAFVVMSLLYITLPFWLPALFWLMSAFGLLYFSLIAMDSIFKTQSFKIGILSIITSFIQLYAYGIGFLSEYFKK